MKSLPWIIRHEWIILAMAIACPIVAVGLGVYANSEGHLLPAIVFGPLALIFIWGNGLFWWLVFYYPDQCKPGTDPPMFESRMSRAGSFARGYGKTFFIGHTCICLIFTYAVIGLIAA